MKTRPRTHINVVVKEMPDKMQSRVDAWEAREELWRDHISSKAEEFGALFPDVQFALPQNKAEMHRHNTKKVTSQNQSLPAGSGLSTPN